MATYTWDAAKRLSSLASGAGTYSDFYHPGLNSHTTLKALTLICTKKLLFQLTHSSTQAKFIPEKTKSKSKRV